MQLTYWGTRENIIYPTYEQIWYWKRNIDASIDVVREKIGYSKAKFPTLTPYQKKMNVYSLFRNGYYWKWEKDKITKKYDWIPRCNKDSKDPQEIKRYQNSGVYEADRAVKNEGKNTCQ